MSQPKVIDNILSLKEVNKVFAAEFEIVDPEATEATNVLERNKLENSKGNDRGRSVGDHRETD